MKICRGICLAFSVVVAAAACDGADRVPRNPELRKTASAAVRTAAEYYHTNVASHGGYVYHYSLDLQQRWGEGPATKSQIWIQPPGTPTVGLAYLKAYETTGDTFYLRAASDAALAVVYGQLKSGGWTNSVDFDPRSPLTAAYRNGKGRGKDNSSLDDGQTQSAIRLLIHADKALGFKSQRIHQAAVSSLDALLKAQFPSGGFPQVWTGPVNPKPVLRASYPDHDWRTEGRIKNYWDMATLNDNVTGYVADTLIDAARIYRDTRYTDAVKKLGDFLLLAQMPEPQPGWAQQYNDAMQPIWARKFEPPGVSGDETQEVLETLMTIASVTKESKYLEPIPAALAWLRRSQLADGQLARYYELKSNRPLYMSRRGKTYTLTYDDSDLPSHYGWKTESRITELSQRYSRLNKDRLTADSATPYPTETEIIAIIDQLDSIGRWVTVFDGKRLVGQAKMPIGTRYLSSQTFSDNVATLCDYLQSTK